jgi:transposase
MLDLEDMVSLDHPVRGIWEFVNRLDLADFYKKIKTIVGKSGSPAFDPRILLTLWIYAYSDGISSARELSQLCEKDAVYQWICGRKSINHHTLSDFRIDNKKELDELFTKILGILSHEGLITMKRITQDGTKIKANASGSSFRKKNTLKKYLKLAEKQVELLSDPDSESVSVRKKKAQQRAANEKLIRLEKAMEEYKELEKNKKKKKKEIRVSKTDPEGRVMKNSSGGYEPSYNAQLAIDTENKLIVGKEAINEPADYNALIPMMEQVKLQTGNNADQVLVDGGYNSYSNIINMSEKNIDLIAGENSMNKITKAPYIRRGIEEGFYAEKFKYKNKKNVMVCPNNKILEYSHKEKFNGGMKYYYLADLIDCKKCQYQSQCCGASTHKGRTVTRSEYNKVILDFQKKMKTKKAQKIYKTRAENAEFPNAWIKDKFKLRQFRLCGLKKVNIELTIAVISYNIVQWLRLIWKEQLKASMAM